MNKASWLLCLLLVAASLSAAGDNKIHSVNFPTGDAAWSVTLQSGGVEQKAASPAPKPSPGASVRSLAIQKVDIVRKGALRHDTVTFADGQTGDWWWTNAPAFVLFQDRPGGVVTTLRTSQMSENCYDQSSFSWVGASTYKGTVTLSGKKCRYYEMKVSVSEEDVRTLRAWIDEQTARPLAWTTSDKIAFFAYDKPLPDAPLAMPANFQAQFDSAAAGLQAPKQFGVH